MKPDYPSAEAYSAEAAIYPAMTVVDLRSEAAPVKEPYRNQVLFDINDGCMRLAVFEGEYRWHVHPASDELFLVVGGRLEIEFGDGRQVSLTEWQGIVVPAGMVHRTRAVGRTVNVTFEKQNAETVFVEPPGSTSSAQRPA
jgi:mannose-6-phosphate isomerase-like protein (cupin superfamily)